MTPPSRRDSDAAILTPTRKQQRMRRRRGRGSGVEGVTCAAAVLLFQLLVALLQSSQYNGPPFSFFAYAYIDESSGSHRRHQLYFRALQRHYLYNQFHKNSTTTTPTASAKNTSLSNTSDETATTATAAAKLAYLTYIYTSYRDHQPFSSAAQHQPQIRKRMDRTASLHDALPIFPPSKRQANKQLIQSMFQHGWDNYLIHGFPDELKPISCLEGTFDLVHLPGLTMIDSLDTLLVLGNYTEFARSIERVRRLYYVPSQHHQQPTMFAVDQNVSVFETTIRVLGGLLSAHQLAVAHLPEKVLHHHVFDPNSRNIRWGYTHDNVDNPRSEDDVAPTDRSATFGRPASTQHPIDQVNSPTTSTTTVDPSLGTAPTLSRNWSAKDSFYHDVILASFLQRLQERNRNHDPPPRPYHATATATTPCNVAHPSPEEDDNEWGVCFSRSDDARFANATASTATATTSTVQPSSSSNKQPEVRYYEYDGCLLELAQDLGNRLLVAFDTPTGIPYGTVNLLYGVPPGETPVASLAGGGTLSLEFHLLTQLTHNPQYAQAATLATRALFVRQSPLGLYGKHIDVRNGQWTESLSGIGSNSDSFLEYLAKHYFLLPHDVDFWIMLVSAYTGVHQFAREGEWYVDVEMNQGSKRGHARRVFESLMAFYPGLQVLLGEITPAARSTNSYFLVREWLGYLPERFSYPSWKVDAGRGAGKHPLRPELLESAYFLHRATRGLTAGGSSSGWLWAQDFALHKLAETAKVKCGYAGISHLSPDTSGDVTSEADVHLMDEMPSFFLSETLKYLYLSFDDDNLLHTDDSREWIFTTEAHPIHYIEPTSSNIFKPKAHVSSRFAAERETLKNLLRDRLKTRTHRRHGTLEYSLKSELWSDKTTYKSYASKLHNVMKETHVHQVETLMATPGSSSTQCLLDDPRHVIAPFVPDSICPTEFKNDTRQSSNLAHLAPNNLGLGPGTLFKKACPNVYSSDMLWLNALNGGAVDYSEIYVSVTRDTLVDHPIDYLVLGSAEALGVHGTGVYPGSSRLVQNTCAVPDAEDAAPAQEEEDDATKNANAKRQHLATPGNVIQIQSAEFGTFEVMPEADGSGFYIHLVNSGETLVTTFFDEFAMTYSSTPKAGTSMSADGSTHGATKNPSPWRRMGSKLTSIFGGSGGDRVKHDDAPFANVPTYRRVLIADFEGNTFSCEVEVFETYVDESFEGGENENDTHDNPPPTMEEILATFPCAPARFGLTEMELLAKSGGVSIQAPAFPPPSDDKFGCQGLSEDEMASHSHRVSLPAGGDEDANIRIVRRGECSFYAKTVNQKLRHNAHGVIVINDHENDIFIMTTHEDAETVSLDPEILPAAVLLTGLDGEELLEKLAVDQDDDAAQVGVRISITRQPNSLEGRSDDFEWPFVLGSAGALTVFAESGWGIQATKRIARNDWQLQLLKREAFDGAT